jgi:hypothetical protein
MQTDSQTETAHPGSPHPAGSAIIMHQGYIIELADGGPWLKNDLTWTPIWDERGVWHDLTDAELALARSLSPTENSLTPDQRLYETRNLLGKP